MVPILSISTVEIWQMTPILSISIVVVLFSLIFPSPFDLSLLLSQKEDVMLRSELGPLGSCGESV